MFNFTNEIKKLKKFEISWEDSQSFSSWNSYSETEKWMKRDCAECRSVGFLIHEDDRFICLAQNLFIRDEDPREVQSFGDVIKIPKACVRKKRRLPE